MICVRNTLFSYSQFWYLITVKAHAGAVKGLPTYYDQVQLTNPFPHQHFARWTYRERLPSKTMITCRYITFFRLYLRSNIHQRHAMEKQLYWGCPCSRTPCSVPNRHLLKPRIHDRRLARDCRGNPPSRVSPAFHRLRKEGHPRLFLPLATGEGFDGSDPLCNKYYVSVSEKCATTLERHESSLERK